MGVDKQEVFGLYGQEIDDRDDRAQNRENELLFPKSCDTI